MFLFSKSRSSLSISMMLLLFLLFSTISVQAYTQICRCDCGTNYTVVELPDEGLSYTASCTNCTKKFCLSQNFTICQGVDDVLVSASCFQRESLKEQLFIYTFIIITSGLLLYATIFPYAQSKISNLRGGGISRNQNPGNGQ